MNHVPESEDFDRAIARAAQSRDRRTPWLPHGWWILPGLILALLVAVFFAGRASAQTRSATLSFVRPTTYIDGSAIATDTAVSYHVYQGARGAEKTRVATITGTTATVSTGLLPGETCWQVSAVANGVESALSNEACKVFPWPAPGTVTITVT